MSDLPENEWGIYDLIETAQNQLNPDRATLTQVLQKADRLVELHPDSPEPHFLRGWALYHLWDYGFGGSREALDEFRLLLHLNPLHQWALWFAIVLSVDIGEDEASIDFFARLDRAYFVEEGKDWRYLKAWEYALCSHLRLGHLRMFEDGIKRLMQEFVKMTDDPDEILERPNQLMAVYKDLRSDSSSLASGNSRDALVHLLEEQLALLIPGGWIRPEELSRR